MKINEKFKTSDHCGVLNAGGLLLIIEEDFEEEDERDLAGYDQTIKLSPGELLQIAALVEKNREYLETREKEINTYFEKVVNAWLDEFSEEAKKLCDKGRFWWPEIRNEAYYTLLRVSQEGSNPVLSEWYLQTRKNKYFPFDQQLTLILRKFKQAYYAKYPIPNNSEEE
jgi:hypothetical protein